MKQPVTSFTHSLTCSNILLLNHPIVLQLHHLKIQVSQFQRNLNLLPAKRLCIKTISNLTHSFSNILLLNQTIVLQLDHLDYSQSPIFSWDHLDIPCLTVTGILIFNVPEGAGVGDYSSGGGDEKNRGTVITSLQLAFTECIVPATQAFDWSLDNRC